MSDQLRFDGQVAIVTGAGGSPSLGRSYAHLLAERGASVVVNDLDTNAAVVDEITAAGGSAVADHHDVSTEYGARDVVKSALDAFGRVDVLVNNAGVVMLARFGQITPADMRRIVDVHLWGHIWMCRAVWPHMGEQGYGRIVNISSAAVWGLPYTVIYGAAKAGVIGLTRGLALDGEDLGIKVNALIPTAATVAVSKHLADDDHRARYAGTAEAVAPAMAFLAHAHCPVSGECLDAKGGHVARTVFETTRGYADDALTPEAVRDHWEQIVDPAGATEVPRPGEVPLSARKIKPYVPTA